MPNLFTRAKVVELQGKDVIVITVDKSNRLCGISSGEYYKRLGKNSKPYTPDRMEETFDEENDYSSRVINQSCVDDINLLEVYKLKEKLKTRDLQSTLVDLDDISFLKDLSLLVETEEGLKINVAGLLFVGKETSIQRFLPQVAHQDDR